MSGEINVKSELSKGSNFFFNIRVTPVPVEQYKSSSYKQIRELLKEVRDTRILVADKHASTTTLVKQLLPGTVVDGVYSVQELLSCNLKNYSVIVIGLFLSLDSKSPTRVDRIKQFLERGQCVLVMHYPTNLIGEILGNSNTNNSSRRDTNALPPQNKKTRTDHLISVLDDDNSLIVSEDASTDAVKKDSQSRAVVRIPVPLRRKMLLRTIVNMFNDTSSISQSPSPSSVLQQYHSLCKKTTRSKGRKVQDLNEGVITEEERAQFSKMHILIAEGIIQIISINEYK